MNKLIKIDKKEKKRKRRKIQFSKLLVSVPQIASIYIILFTSFMVLKTLDLSPLPYLITAVLGSGGLTAYRYYVKSERENIEDMKQNYDPNYNEKHFTGMYDNNDI